MIQPDVTYVPLPPMTPGQQIARGAARALRGYDVICLPEFVPTAGLRVDLIGIAPKGEIWIIECKSSRVDFTSDRKWQGYLPWCDRFFWAVDTDFPQELLPEDSGLLLADAHGGELVRMPAAVPLAPARRKALTQALARTALLRLQGLRDPATALLPPLGGA